MKFIDNQGITDPRINLAIEEYALKHLPNSDDYLLFYINEPSIIIGKNQNTIEEINATYVEENHIHVVRRLSGGGAVYHDLGNLNFSFITNDDGESFHNFRKFTAPVVQALKTLGVEAELTGRNDIQVGERKISGNAQYSTKGRMFSHGTLLFDSEMENVVSALKVNAEKIQSKGIKSIRSRVANISEFLETKMTIEEFRQAILRSIFGEGEIEEYKLTEKDWENIHELSRSRYQTWEWNYGKSPKSNYRQSKRFDIGTVEIQLDIEKGKMKEVKIYGDFFGVRDVAELEAVLRDTPYDRSSISERLADINLQEFFGNLDQASFVDLLLV
ncbi:lipoate--protein ligase [Brevibacillus sp. BC25]|uniref:lipoate--protein ligase n=1 Tax=Brevibacillus sp. BC25 TaxID=1144308 RepID=UPI00027138D9|nr:lipoate--protein ligase [Brevibacillus sp. BC25]EJL20301.1 lipoyltransferase and lipoate-protein ligase [Brevibacillus sp. BC25]